MKRLRFGIAGAGFWARYQLAGWQELPGAECVAVCDALPDRAQALAQRFQISKSYGSFEAMLASEQLDFVDIVTSPETHARFVLQAAARRIPIICQKPLAPQLAESRTLVAACREARVPLLVNENFRWQTPIRKLHEVLQRGDIGEVFRGRLQFANSFPVFDNQPALREVEQFILADLGVHILDVARFLFGEPESVYCRTQQVNPTIRGEDVATVVLGLPGSRTVLCDMSYATRMEHERFPQTFAFIEGTKGSVELTADYSLRVTTASGTHASRVAPPRYDWADPAYDVVHASIVDCQRNLLAGLNGSGQAETTGTDNLKTLELVFAAYESAARGTVIDLARWSGRSPDAT